MPLTKVTLIASTAALGLLIVVGCGSSVNDHDVESMPSPAASSTPHATAAASPASGPHNEADVMFASMMIPHHNQAIEMCDLLLAKADIDPKITAMAEQIQAAQAPEVAQMSGWLAGWGEDADTGGMHHDNDDGMLSQAEMDALKNATGTEATKLFLDGMIKHHMGAITMAEAELEQGASPDAKKLAQAIIDTQEAEIIEMKKLGGT